MTNPLSTEIEQAGAERLTQIDIDALWLACRVEIYAGDTWTWTERKAAQLRLQRLVSAGIVEHGPGQEPKLRSEQP